jgi:hypothetical protein
VPPWSEEESVSARKSSVQVLFACFNLRRWLLWAWVTVGIFAIALFINSSNLFQKLSEHLYTVLFFSWSCMLNQSGILFRIVFRHEDPESYLAGKVSNGGTKTRSQTYDHDGRCISAAMWEQNEALWRPTGEETHGTADL